MKNTRGKTWDIQIANSDCFVCCFEYVAAWNKVTKLCACVCVFAYFLYYNISLSRGRISNRFSKTLPWQIRIVQTAAVRNSEMRSRRWGRVTTETSQLNGGEIGPSFRHSKRAEGGGRKKKNLLRQQLHVCMSTSPPLPVVAAPSQCWRRSWCRHLLARWRMCSAFPPARLI